MIRRSRNGRSLPDEEQWGERRSGDQKRRSFDDRTPFERDRARIIHSASFRRLQAKTQVLGIAEGDFHRTRLTHSMEVAQVSGGIVKRLRKLAGRKSVDTDLKRCIPEVALTEAVAFSHDLGHPPFGHGGEVALNYVMRDDGGFEGNGQSLRILAKLESHTQGFGLDATRRTLLGILKYPAAYEDVARKTAAAGVDNFRLLSAEDWKPLKCYLGCDRDVVEWIFAPFTGEDRRRFGEAHRMESPQKHAKSKYKSFDASIMELADDIAYGVHDLEDGIALDLIKPDHWKKVTGSLDRAWAKRFNLGTIESMEVELFSGKPGIRKRIIGALVNALITSALVKEVGGFSHPLLHYNATLEDEARGFLEALKGLTSTHIVQLQSVQTLEYKGRFVVMSLFEALTSQPVRLLPTQQAYEYQKAAAGKERTRVVCDYVAGMTDIYAGRMYARLFTPGSGNVFERL